MRIRGLVCITVLLAVVTAPVQAKLRARYCYPKNHDAAADPGGSPDVYRLNWLADIYAGMWEGYDDSNGFDGVTTGGDLSSSTKVSAEYWIDSVFSSSVYGERKDAPLLDGWATPLALLDPSYTFSRDGYCVLAVGGIKIETAGTYEFSISAGDGAMVFIDKNGNGLLDVAAETDANEAEDECLNGYLRENTTDPWGWGFNNEVTESVVFDTPGLYRIAVWYWDHSQVGYLELEWKKPGGAFEPISGTNGDLGEATGGLPSVNIVSIDVDGVDKPQNEWSNISVDACTPVTFTAEATAMLDETPVYVWDFYGDASVVCTTTVAAVTYKYPYSADIFIITPEVMVRRGTTYSLASSEEDVIFLFVSGTEETCDNSQLPCTGTPVGHNAGRTPAARFHGPRLRMHDGVLVLPTASMRVSVHDIAGRVVMPSRVVGGTALDLSFLLPGAYLLRAEGQGWSISSPLHVTAR